MFMSFLPLVKPILMKKQMLHEKMKIRRGVSMGNPSVQIVAILFLDRIENEAFTQTFPCRSSTVTLLTVSPPPIVPVSSKPPRYAVKSNLLAKMIFYIPSALK